MHLLGQGQALVDGAGGQPGEEHGGGTQGEAEHPEAADDHADGDHHEEGEDRVVGEEVDHRRPTRARR